jgi:cytochrome c1
MDVHGTKLAGTLFTSARARRMHASLGKCGELFLAGFLQLLFFRFWFVSTHIHSVHLAPNMRNSEYSSSRSIFDRSIGILEQNDRSA